MNTCRALYNKLICVSICAESTVGCFNVHLHWICIAVANYFTTKHVFHFYNCWCCIIIVQRSMWIHLEILPYRTMMLFSPTIFEIFEQHINIRTTYFITGMQAKCKMNIFVWNAIFLRLYLFHVTYAFCLIMFKIISVRQNAKYSMYKQ